MRNQTGVIMLSGWDVLVQYMSASWLYSYFHSKNHGGLSWMMHNNSIQLYGSNVTDISRLRCVSHIGVMKNLGLDVCDEYIKLHNWALMYETWKDMSKMWSLYARCKMYVASINALGVLRTWLYSRFHVSGRVAYFWGFRCAPLP